MRHITATVDLDASPDRVSGVLADTGSYSAWNPPSGFVVSEPAR